METPTPKKFLMFAGLLLIIPIIFVSLYLTVRKKVENNQPVSKSLNNAYTAFMVLSALEIGLIIVLSVVALFKNP